MYYYLAIVTDRDILKGNIRPFYTLCQSHGESESRSGWRVVKRGSKFETMPKVLVTQLTGNDMMLDFLSAYRTRDHMHGSSRHRHHNTKKYYPKGALFWFECDRYGRRTGPAVFVYRVPVPRSETDQGFQRLKESRARFIPEKELFSREPAFVNLPSTHIKPKLTQ